MPSAEGFMLNLKRSLKEMLKDSGDIQWPSRKWSVVLAIACIVAISASGYLGYVALTSSKVAGCGGGKLFNCGHVISSRWSLWMGIPVSMLAVGTYVAMGVALFAGSSTRFNSSTRQIGWAIVTVLALSAGAAALWFVSLQIFALGHLCTYCLVAHTCGLVAAGTVLWTRPIGTSGLKPAAILGLLGVSILIVGQLLTPEPNTFRIETFEAPAAGSEVFEFEPPVFDVPDTSTSASIFMPKTLEVQLAIATILKPTSLLVANVTQEPTTQDKAEKPSKADGASTSKVSSEKAKPNRRMVSINGGTMQLDVAQWPIAGSTDAKYIFVEMFDYSCPHCRNTHAAIKGATEKLNGDLAVVVLPIPLSSTCNKLIQVTDPKFVESCEISKLAIAVWRVDPAKFTQFHNWMFATAVSPTYAVAKAHAETIVDIEKLNAEINSQVPIQYIAKTVELYKRAGSGNVPKLIFPSTTVVGEFTSGDSLVEIIKQQIK